MVRTSDRLLYKYKVLTRASLDEDLDDMAREFNSETKPAKGATGG